MTHSSLSTYDEMNTVLTIQECMQALDSEIAAIKSNEKQYIQLYKGTASYKISNDVVYHFHTFSDKWIPDNSPVSIEINGVTFDGEVIHAHDGELEIKIEGFKKREILEAKLYNNSWKLLEALKDSLESVKEEKDLLSSINQLLTTKNVAAFEKERNPDHSDLLHHTFTSAVTYIWGPPGTGKTYQLSRIAKEHFEHGHRVLLLSASNSAVDVLCKETFQLLEEKDKNLEGKIIRYGNTYDPEIRTHPYLYASKLVQFTHPEIKKDFDQLLERKVYLRKFSSENKASHQVSAEMNSINEALQETDQKRRSLEKEAVKSAKLVATTLSKLAIDHELSANKFDVVIIDEASMAYLPYIIMASCIGKRVVVCGDFRQLPSVVLSNNQTTKKYLQNDIFYHTTIQEQVKNGEHPKHLFILDEQRRTHPQIAMFTNEQIYYGKIKNHKSTWDKQAIADLAPFTGFAATLLDTSNLHHNGYIDQYSGSRFNPFACLLSLHVAVEGIRSGVESIGIVTPYRAQVELMEQLLDDVLQKTRQRVTVATVHRFQGSERDMIIFDTVDSNSHPSLGKLQTNAHHDRLLNVALTRSRGKFIMLANRDFWEQHRSSTNMFFKLFQYFTSINRVVSPLSITEEEGTKKLHWLFSENANVPLQLIRDIEKAERQITITIPEGVTFNKPFWEALRKTKAQISIHSTDQQKGLAKAHMIQRECTSTMIIIDDKILYLPTPFEGKWLKKGKEIENPVVYPRLNAPNFVKAMKRMIGI